MQQPIQNYKDAMKNEYAKLDFANIDYSILTNVIFILKSLEKEEIKIRYEIYNYYKINNIPLTIVGLLKNVSSDIIIADTLTIKQLEQYRFFDKEQKIVVIFLKCYHPTFVEYDPTMNRWIAFKHNKEQNTSDYNIISLLSKVIASEI